MLSSVRVRAKIIEDDTGIKSEIPVILTEQGVLEPLLNYLLNKQQEGKSQTWMRRVVYATQKLIEYMEANKSGFSDPKLLFQTFVKRLYSGSIGEDGLDPSGLYWIPSSRQTTNQLITALTGFTDWLAQTQKVKPLNLLIEADSYTSRLNYAAWFRKNQHDFLGHIKDKTFHKTIRKARLIRGRRELVRTDDDAISFPEKDFQPFFLEGIGGSKDPRAALRDKLILLLMHGGGLRESEAISLWVTDVFENPQDSESALVRIYHPEEGRAPNNWRGRNGASNRVAYLMENYSLTPRNRMMGTMHLGWKTRVMDGADNFIQVHWFPNYFGRLFMILWRDYLHILASMERHHPYAFVAFSKKHFGAPYTKNAFHCNYQNGLRRIRILPNKAHGHSPHGHRHAYGRRLTKAEVDPIIRKKCLHHASFESQTVYTAPSQEQVSKSLNIATARLADSAGTKDNSVLISDWHQLVEHGFQDIDPQGLFTGQYSKLRSK